MPAVKCLVGTSDSKFSRSRIDLQYSIRLIFSFKLCLEDLYIAPCDLSKRLFCIIKNFYSYSDSIFSFFIPELRR